MSDDLEVCWSCQGSGMMLGDNGDPCICSHCKYDGVAPREDGAGMSDDLIKQWDEYVESMGSVMGDVEHMAQQMRDRIEQLEREQSRLHTQCDGLMQAAMNNGQALILAEAKLAKAIDEMTWALPILKRCLTHPNDEWKVEDFRAVLSEIDGWYHE